MAGTGLVHVRVRKAFGDDRVAGPLKGPKNRSPKPVKRPPTLGSASRAIIGIREETENLLSASKQPRDHDVLRDFLLRFAAVLPQEAAPSKH